jgi:hypothetical protein
VVTLARADHLVLLSGESVEGKIIMETPGRVILKQSAEKRVIEKNTIATIERSPAADPVKNDPVETPPATLINAATAPSVEFWPPAKSKLFPDLVLLNHEGNYVRLSSFRGKIIVLEPVGMTCSACQAFSGGNKVGGLGGIAPQADCAALDDFFTNASAGATLSDPRVVWVQLLLYNLNMQAPTKDDLKNWRDHFPTLRRPNCVVLAATPEMLGSASYAMIPGVQLIDRNFVLRSDFRGHGGGDDINRHLLPLMKELIQGKNH